MALKFVFTLGLLLPLNSFGACLQPGQKPVIAFAGQALRPAVLPGILSRLAEANIQPSAIIASCGGSISAVLNAGFEKPEQTKEYMRSSQFHEFLYSVQPSRERTGLGFFALLLNQASWKAKIPDLGRIASFNPPEKNKIHLLPNHVHLSWNQLNSKIIVNATRVLHEPSRAGLEKAPGEKLYAESYFSANDLLEQVEFKPHIARKYPASNVAELIDLQSNNTIFDAMIAATAELFVFSPQLIGENYYWAGLANLYPVETAHDVARALGGVPVVMTKNSSLGAAAGPMSSPLGFDLEERRKAIQNDKSVIWIDPGPTGFGETVGFGPDARFATLRPGVYTSVPENFAAFQNKIDQQWQIGRDLADTIICGKKAAN